MLLLRLLDFSVSAGDASSYFEGVAWAVAIVLGILLVAVWKYLEYDGIDASQRRHLRSILPQLFRAKGVTVTIDRRDGFSEYREQFRELLTRDPDDPADAPEPRVRDELRAFGADIRTVGPDFPPLAVRGALEGVALLLFGSILFLSATWWERIVGAPDIGDVGVLGAIEIALSQTIGSIPGLDIAFAWVLTIGIIVGEWLYGLWLPLGVFLILAAVAFVVVDWLTVEDLDVTLYPNRRRFGFGVLGTIMGPLFATWSAFLLGQAIGSVVGGSIVGTILGGLAGAVTSLAILFVVGKDLSRRLIDRQDDPELFPYFTATYLILRRALAIAAVVAVPLVVIYAAQIVWTGRLMTVLGIIWSAPLLTRVGLLVGILGVLAAIFIRAEITAELGEAFDRAARSTALRSWLFARGVPFTSMALTFALVWAMIGSVPIGNVPVISSVLGLWPPTVAAVVVGAVVRGLTLAWVGLKYRFIDLAGGDPGVFRLSVECLPELTDADDEALYLVRVGTLDLAHRDVDELLRDVETVVEAKFDGEAVPATMSSYYWDDAKRGTVDLSEVRRELRGDVRTRIEATLREHGGRMDRQTLDEELSKAYPRPAVDGALASLQRASDLSHRRGDYVYHK